jgi:hypothetical protein
MHHASLIYQFCCCCVPGITLDYAPPFAISALTTPIGLSTASLSDGLHLGYFEFPADRDEWPFMSGSAIYPQADHENSYVLLISTRRNKFDGSGGI